jgi:hypothetical protein
MKDRKLYLIIFSFLMQFFYLFYVKVTEISKDEINLMNLKINKTIFLFKLKS